MRKEKKGWFDEGYDEDYEGNYLMEMQMADYDSITSYLWESYSYLAKPIPNEPDLLEEFWLWRIPA